MVLTNCVLFFCSCGPTENNNSTNADTKTPIVENTTGKTIIQHTSSNKQWLSDINIISSKGTVIYCDAFETPEDVMNSLKPDILCVTHVTHVEHVDQALIDKYTDDTNCKMSLEKEEEFSFKDANVTGIKSSHGITTLDPDYIDNTNIIYVFEVDELRIAHMGGMNQTEISQEQLEKLGEIDILLISLSMYSDMEIENVYHMCEQLKPAIIMPTHYSDDDYLETLCSTVDGIEVVENAFVVSKDDLKDGKRKVILLSNTLY